MTTVLALGYFDLFHVGHLNYLQAAKKMGDRLIVGIAPDSFALLSKQKPVIISWDERATIIKALAIVDSVFMVPYPISDTINATEWIKSLNINIVACGDEWKNSSKWNNLTLSLATYDISVSFIPKTEGISSTLIKQKILTESAHLGKK